jgi:copper(I)-binding protein
VRTQPVTARRIGIGLLAAVAVLTSGCAAGEHAMTAEEKPTIDATNADIGSIQLRGLAIESPVTSTFYAKGSSALVTMALINSGKGSDTLTGISSPAFSSWGVFPKLAQAEAAQAAPSSSSAAPSAASSAPTTSAPSGSSSAPGTPAPGASTSPSVPAAAPSSSVAAVPTGTKSVTVAAGLRLSWGVPSATGGLLLMKFTKSVYPGTTVPITFTFDKAGSTTVSVPVQLTPGANQSTIPGPSATGQIG